jgi:hypothetical protein
VAWFNRHRLLEQIGYAPSADAETETAYSRSLSGQAVIA